MTEKEEMTRLFRAVARLIESMSNSEYDLFVSGQWRPTVAARKDRKKRATERVSAEQLEGIISRLRDTKSREEAREILKNDSRMLLKDNLNELARLLQVHVTKNDKREEIEDKVVEFVVGVRLRSEAIQGLNLKGSNSST